MHICYLSSPWVPRLSRVSVFTPLKACIWVRCSFTNTRCHEPRLPIMKPWHDVTTNLLTASRRARLLRTRTVGLRETLQCLCQPERMRIEADQWNPQWNLVNSKLKTLQTLVEKSERTTRPESESCGLSENNPPEAQVQESNDYTRTTDRCPAEGNQIKTPQ